MAAISLCRGIVTVTPMIQWCLTGAFSEVGFAFVKNAFICCFLCHLCRVMSCMLYYVMSCHVMSSDVLACVYVCYHSSGALNDHFTSRKEQRQSLKLMRECEKQLVILANAEEEAKEALVKMIELKLDCQELMASVESEEQTVRPPASKKEGGGVKPANNAIVVGIIWGSAGGYVCVNCIYIYI
jgi:hypothetical protein